MRAHGQLKEARKAVTIEQMEISRLPAKTERTILKNGGVLCQGTDMKYSFTEDNKTNRPVSLQYEVLGVSSSGDHEHLVRRWCAKRILVWRLSSYAQTATPRSNRLIRIYSAAFSRACGSVSAEIFING